MAAANKRSKEKRLRAKHYFKSDGGHWPRRIMAEMRQNSSVRLNVLLGELDAYFTKGQVEKLNTFRNSAEGKQTLTALRVERAERLMIQEKNEWQWAQIRNARA